MSFHWCDNLHTTVFTPRDYQVELLATAYERNTLICLGHKSSKEFIALKLLQELSRQVRNTNKISLFLTCNEGTGIDSLVVMLQHLTDVNVVRQEKEFVLNAATTTSRHQVFVVHPRLFHEALCSKKLLIEQVYLMILDDCHELHMFNELMPIFKEFLCQAESTSKQPKILSLGGPLHSAGCTWHELTAMLNVLEESVHCKAETASDIVTVLRYCSKPIEYIVQCAPYRKDELILILEDIIKTRKAFLINHRYDPTEIYNTDEFLEELKGIPDPKKEPLEFLDIVLTVLHEMGPWCADRVAISLYHRIEKQKIKTPHERHYILLCLVNSALVLIHSICERTFRQITDPKKLVEKYSSPKVLRLFEILRIFKPEEFQTTHNEIQRMNSDLEKLDFQKVTRALEKSCQSVEHIAKQQIESQSIVENLDPIVKRSSSELSSDYARTAFYTRNNVAKTGRNNTFRAGQTHNQGRGRRRMFTRRPMRQQNDAGDTLCAIIFCNSNHIAHVLFDLLTEMRRHDADLHFLKCHYLADRVADPLTEPKEAENEHRRQEEVLKRFRMHDCNVLIGTAVLEEGIDIPKCNLVVRWDMPSTYRSYVQCKGRARATPAYHIILISPQYVATYKNEESAQEHLSKRSHQYVCQLPGHEEQKSGEELSSSSAEEYEDDIEEDNKTVRYTIASCRGTVKILNPEVIRYKSPKQNLNTGLKAITAGENVELTEIETINKDVENNENTLSLREIKDDDESDAEEECNAINNSSICSSNNCNSNQSSFSKYYNVIDLSGCFEKLNLNDDSELNESEMNVTNESDEEEVKNKQETQQATQMNVKKRKAKCFVVNNEDQQLQQQQQVTQEQEVYERELVQMVETTGEIVQRLAQYREIEKMLLHKCANTEPSAIEHQHADNFTRCIEPHQPLAHMLTSALVDLSNAIALVNKYCSKLPSDTFTKLTALWRCAKTQRNNVDMYQYTIRLPINSPLKYDIVGLPMPTNILARRMAAFQACVELHRCGELDDNLQPIGKEGFKAIESDWENFELETQDEQIVRNNREPRPGTTKRRQYYYKRIASEFCDCRPTANIPSYLYLLDLTLQCPIPEEQNTRGRKIYPPEEAQQGFGILTLKKIPKVSSFPIFTRSGEVKVSIELCTERIVLTEQQIHSINTFVNYTFTNVLRLQKFLMLFDPDSTENCIFIVPTIKTPKGKVIDWQFLSLIEENANKMPTAVSEEERKNTEFDANKFKDAVVMPWYRNQDQPQYFYVAEICPHLTPLSCFPGENYHTFKHYYLLKYNLNIQSTKQPLLDVDHTSARLNFLTPRYVNRKGVALPTSSEETKRAKRENLEQKQILVPELCTVHPFPASLWRTAVCLPCILYRINGLLLADDIRKKVSADIGLGKQEIADDFEWPILDFGWSLSEVLRKSKESKQINKHKQDDSESEINELAKKQNGDKWDEKSKEEKSANEIVKEGEKKLLDNNLVEIGTWSNEMANNISLTESLYSDDEDEQLDYLPSNVSFCDSQTRYGSPTFWDVKKAQLKPDNGKIVCVKPAEIQQNENRRKLSEFTYYDSDDSLASSEEGINGNNWYSDDDDEIEEDDGLLRIAFTSKNEAESFETELDIEKRKRQLSIIQATNANERNYQQTKNLQVGYNFETLKSHIQPQLQASREAFDESTALLRKQILGNNMLVQYNDPVILLRTDESTNVNMPTKDPLELIKEMLPYVPVSELLLSIGTERQTLNLQQLTEMNQLYTQQHEEENFTIISCGDIFDNFNDKHRLQVETTENGLELKKIIKLTFESKKLHKPMLQRNATNQAELNDINTQKYNVHNNDRVHCKRPFSFSDQPMLKDHPGPSPSIILQALTMSNANDGINLERLETIGDSFLKYAITTYLYITYENVHEGKLSHLRSKQVANLNLYRLGRRKMLGEYMIATKFEPHDNWLPPCYYVPKELEKALIEAKIPPHHWKLVDLPNIKKLTSAEICKLVREKADQLGLFNDEQANKTHDEVASVDDFTCFIPYNLVTQHSIPDKSVADCVEALIGAYLIECGTRGALLFMAWLGIRVLPYERISYNPDAPRIVGSTNPDADNMITVYGEWFPPSSPLLHYTPNAEKELEAMLEGFEEFERVLCYKFRDRSYLLQAMTHASYSPNRLTDCYQRLEFLGDAVLDYLITRHLYEDPRQHSPGALTDLRSALVNNTIFASLAVRHGFHKYFRHLSPGLNEVIDRFVRIQNENGHSISEEYYLLSEEECDDAEDVEVPKALGDVFESIAGAIFLDSNMSLDTVWKVYSNMMKPEIEQFSNSVPKSPIRELLELEPETAKFGKPEKLADGRRVRVTVDVFCKGTFRGIGRNYRIAKCTAAKCALRQLKKQGLISKKD